MKNSVRLLLEHQNREAFHRALGKLQLELALGTPRRHLDTLVELAVAYLSACGESELSVSLRAELGRVMAMVATRPNLRLVKAVRR